jgi:hypothetical protein
VVPALSHRAERPDRSAEPAMPAAEVGVPLSRRSIVASTSMRRSPIDSKCTYALPGSFLPA